MSEPSLSQLCELLSYTPKGRLLTSGEVAEILRVHPVTVHQFRVRGGGPRYFKPRGTRRVWYSERDLLAWIAEGARASTSQISGK
jgi:hypothetical protein